MISIWYSAVRKQSVVSVSAGVLSSFTTQGQFFLELSFQGVSKNAEMKEEVKHHYTLSETIIAERCYIFVSEKYCLTKDSAVNLNP